MTKILGYFIAFIGQKVKNFSSGKTENFIRRVQPMYKKIVSGVVAAAMVLTTVTGLTNNLTANQTLLQASAAKLSGNELGEATFNEGKGLPWHVCESMTGKLKFNISNGTYNITIVNPGGESNEGESRWDCQV